MPNSDPRLITGNRYRDGRITPSIATIQSLHGVCPDFGTLQCVDCPLGEQRPLEICDASCYTCARKVKCPCTEKAWSKRQEKE